jgi:hypothetical protein
MIQLENIKNARLETIPYEWGFLANMFSTKICTELSMHYPHDHFKSVDGYDGEKSYVYECRSLIHMGATDPTYHNDLHVSWSSFAQDLLSMEYRDAVSQLCKRDLTSVPMEVNIFHYSPGTWMGPHVDLKDKILTHVFYFNEKWNDEDGGCLSILKSNNPDDVFRRISPITGNSVILLSSNHSWHAVEAVKKHSRQSRRSVTVTFYHPASVSTMWPPTEIPALHNIIKDNSIVRLFKRIARQFS